MTINLFVQIIFLVSALNCVAITVLVYRSKNGLRREVLWFFVALTWASVIRIVEANMPEDVVASNIMSIVVGLPLLVTGTRLAYVLARK